MTFDRKSYDLAAHFLQDEPFLNTEQNRRLLAKDIQAAVEDWFWFQKEGVNSELE